MNLLDIKNQLPENVFNLLNEVYTLAGAKELFKKHNVEVLNKEIEIEMIKKVATETETFLKESKDMKEFGQVKQFVDMQINSNEAMLKTAEGFMKSMVEMNIQTAKAQLEMAVKQFTTPFVDKLKEVIETFVVNEDNKTKFLKEAETINLLNATVEIAKIVEDGVKEIETRYAGQKVEAPKEEKKIEKKTKTIEVTKTKVTPTGEGIKTEVTEKKEEIVEETETDNLGLGDLDDLGDLGVDTKEDLKESVGDIDGLGDLNFGANDNDVDPLSMTSGTKQPTTIKEPSSADSLLDDFDVDGLLGLGEINF